MTEYKFLCPRCREILNEFGECWMETKDYYISVRGRETIEYTEGNFVDEKLVEVFCPVCGESFTGYRGKDFLVEIMDDGDIQPYGEYWMEHKVEFERIKAEL